MAGRERTAGIAPPPRFTEAGAVTEFTLTSCVTAAITVDVVLAELLAVLVSPATVAAVAVSVRRPSGLARP